MGWFYLFIYFSFMRLPRVVTQRQEDNLKRKKKRKERRPLLQHLGERRPTAFPGNTAVLGSPKEVPR